MQHENLKNAAILFMQQNYDQHLTGHRQQLADRCAKHLQDLEPITDIRACTISASALAEIESGLLATIDQSETTPNAVVLRMNNGAVLSISAAAIAHVASPYAIAIGHD